MPYPKLKSENYSNLQGLNQKVSQYITNQAEFLKLQNMDAQNPGALTSVPGTTQFLSVGTTGVINGIGSFFDYGLTYSGGSPTYNIFATTQFDFGNITNNTYLSIYSFLFQKNPNPFTFANYNLFYSANQYDFFVYPSVTLSVGVTVISGLTTIVENPYSNYSLARQYSLPKPLWGAVGDLGGVTTTGLTGTILLYSSFVRADGYVGPASGITLTMSGQLYIRLFGPTFPITAGITTTLGFSNFDIVGTRVWMQYLAGNQSTAYPFLNGFAGASGPYGPFSDMLLTSYGTTFILSSLGATECFLNDPNAGIGFIGQDANFAINGIADPDFYIGSFLFGNQGDTGFSPNVPVQPSNPAVLAQYANFLFMGGFLNSPDTVWYSRVGEFEKRDVDAFFDVRSNDGDIVTNLTSFFTQLVIFKINSTSVLSGTDPDTFTLSTVSDQYGCLSPNASAVFEQRLWYLDKKGIIEYNGANVQCVSNKVEPYFKRLNVVAARTVASMVHIKSENKVRTMIPIDGATYANLCIDYDYLANFWTTRTISNASALAITNVGVSNQVTLYGDASGMVYSYGQSLLSDNGHAFTCQLQSRFISDLGNSVEKLFRRLYLDASVPTGSTYNFLVNFYTNQGTTPALSTTMVLSSFQNRIDYGLSAKDLSVEIIYSGGQALKINGFTIEYRFQRAV